MLNNTKHLVEQFEREVWLYLDKDLSPERMQFWNEKIVEHNELQLLLDENKKLTELYKNIPLNEFSEARYSEVVSQAVKKRNTISAFIQKINPFKIENDRILSPVKIAFGGAMAAAAIVILLLSNKPNPVKNLSNEILDWNSEEISQQISEMSTSISLIKDENFKEFLIDKRSKEKLDRDIFSISNGIQKLKEELEDKSL
ncbi:MAG: hypothetical protein HND52_11110 [Ignavibacteriae bacterium]|nr:hypothetical protein [Ignavibacteriota bacterium]NOG98496.1 hypothetical protein [Ignavibacteriota bacterium]